MELLAGENSDAADLADGFLQAIETDKLAYFDDDRMVAHRLGNLIEAYLEKKPFTDGQFSHYRPARYFASTEAMQQRIPDATLDRFENALKTLNSLLK